MTTIVHDYDLLDAGHERGITRPGWERVFSGVLSEPNVRMSTIAGLAESFGAEYGPARYTANMRRIASLRRRPSRIFDRGRSSVYVPAPDSPAAGDSRSARRVSRPFTKAAGRARPRLGDSPRLQPARDAPGGRRVGAGPDPSFLRNRDRGRRLDGLDSCRGGRARARALGDRESHPAAAEQRAGTLPKPGPGAGARGVHPVSRLGRPPATREISETGRGFAPPSGSRRRLRSFDCDAGPTVRSGSRTVPTRSSVRSCRIFCGTGDGQRSPRCGAEACATGSGVSRLSAPWRTGITTAGRECWTFESQARRVFAAMFETIPATGRALGRGPQRRRFSGRITCRPAKASQRISGRRAVRRTFRIPDFSRRSFGPPASAAPKDSPGKPGEP